MREPGESQVLARDLLAFRLRQAAHLRTERDVLEHGLPRKQRERLKHDAALGPRSVDGAAVEQDLAARDRDEAGDHVQERGLAAAGRSDDGDELALRAPSATRRAPP